MWTVFVADVVHVLEVEWSIGSVWIAFAEVDVGFLETSICCVRETKRVLLGDDEVRYTIVDGAGCHDC